MKSDFDHGLLYDGISTTVGDTDLSLKGAVGTGNEERSGANSGAYALKGGGFPHLLV
jgi:hypothetical protein